MLTKFSIAPSCKITMSALEDIKRTGRYDHSEFPPFHKLCLSSLFGCDRLFSFVTGCVCIKLSASNLVLCYLVRFQFDSKICHFGVRLDHDSVLGETGRITFCGRPLQHMETRPTKLYLLRFQKSFRLEFELATTSKTRSSPLSYNRSLSYKYCMITKRAFTSSPSLPG